MSELPPIDWRGPGNQGLRSGSPCPRCGRELRVRNITLSCACGLSLTKPMSKRRMPAKPETFVERMRDSIEAAEEGESDARMFTAVENDPVSEFERRSLSVTQAAIVLASLWFTRPIHPATHPGLRNQQIAEGSSLLLADLLVLIILLFAINSAFVLLKQAGSLIALLTAGALISVFCYLISGNTLINPRIDALYLYLAIPRALLYVWTALLLYRDQRYLLG